MLKTVSSVANAIGALNYKGTWNAVTNAPALASGVGTQGDYYVVSVAGTTSLDGITNWGVGDWAAFSGSAWQRVEGGADGNFVNLKVDGTSTLDGVTSVTGGNFAVSNGSVATAAVVIDANGTALSFTRNTTSYIRNNAAGGQLTFTTNGNSASTVLNLGTTGNVTVGTGNLVIGTSGKGIDFSATAGTGTSELLDDYEEGVWTPGYTSWLANPTVATTAKYTKIGRLVNVSVYLTGGTTQAGAQITGLPFTCGTESSMISTNGSNSSLVFYGTVLGGSTVIGSLSAETLTGTYYAVTATYMV